jgi:DNA-binding SARP family transcriptional activator/Tfp pilus assembly protein PilF
MDAQKTLEIYLLGPFKVAVDGVSIDERQWSRQKPKLLLKLLALQPRHRLHREQAMELLWPNSDSESAINNLHKAIHIARHALQPNLKSAADSDFLVSQGQEIVMQAPEKLWIDVEEFERYADTAIKSLDRECAEAAIGLYGGDLLPEDRYEDWAARRRDQLRDLYHLLLSELSTIYESRSEYHRSIDLLKRLIASDPVDEQAHRNLMRMYGLTGNRLQARRQYQQCAESLRTELDAMPEPATAELHQQIESGAFQQGISRIAILPLCNESADPELDYLTDGLTESIIENLSQLPALRVMAWNTVVRYKGHQNSVDPRTIGRSLGVGFALTGKLVVRGQTLVIAVELINARDNSHVWGGKFQRGLSDLLDLENDIASAITEKLRLTLTESDKYRIARHPTSNPEAYALYLKGRYAWNRRTAASLNQGITYFKQAVEKDPRYALAYAGIADCYALLGWNSVVVPTDCMPRARTAAEKALEINPGLAEAHASLGIVRLFFDWDFSGAEGEFHRAIEINPEYAMARQWYAFQLVILDRQQEAFEQLERAVQSDPLSLSISTLAGYAYYLLRDTRRAIEQIEKVIELDANFAPARFVRGSIYELLGSYAQAAEEFESAAGLSARNPAMLGALGHCYGAAGQTGKAENLLDELQAMAGRTYVTPRAIAWVLLGLERQEEALEWLEKTFQERSAWALLVKLLPVYDNLRSNLRVGDLLRRYHLAE